MSVVNLNKHKVHVTKEGTIPYFDNPVLKGEKSLETESRLQIFIKTSKKLKKGIIKERDLNIIKAIGEGGFITDKQLRFVVKDFVPPAHLSKRLHYLKHNGLIHSWNTTNPFAELNEKYTGWHLSYGGYLLLKNNLLSISGIPDPEIITNQGTKQLQKYAALNEIRIKLLQSNNLIKWEWMPKVKDLKRTIIPGAISVVNSTKGHLILIFERLIQNNNIDQFISNRTLLWEKLISRFKKFSFVGVEDNVKFSPILIWSCGSDSIIKEMSRKISNTSIEQLWISDERLLANNMGILNGWMTFKNNEIQRIILPFLK